MFKNNPQYSTQSPLDSLGGQIGGSLLGGWAAGGFENPFGE
jgi:hypothetical protein